MNRIHSATNWHQISYTIAGFDRLNFVSDIAEAIPQDENCQIAQLSFEANGVEARGWLIIRVQHYHRFFAIHDRLRSVQGVVSIQADQIN